MGRLFLFLAILALLWALYRAFIRYLRSTSKALPEQSASSPDDDPDKLAWYRENGYLEWVRYRIGYTLHTFASGSGNEGETVVEERSSLSPWFLAGSDEARRWVAEQDAKPAEEGEPWSERWIAGRGIRGDERMWLPPGERPS